MPLGDGSVCSEKMAAPGGGEVDLCFAISHSKFVVTVQRAFRAKNSSHVNSLYLKARIIAAVKNIDAPMLALVCGKNLNIVSKCAVTPVVHTPTHLWL